MTKINSKQIKSDYPLWLRLACTAVLVWLWILFSGELSIRYSQLNVASGRIPTSLLVYGVFILMGSGLFLVQVWAAPILFPLNKIRDRLGWTRWIGVGLLGILPALFFCYNEWSEVFTGSWVRVAVCLVFVEMMTWLAARGEKQTWSPAGVMAALLISGSSVVIFSYLRQVIDYPFSLYWSEGNRFWDYSILFGRRLYIYPENLAIPAYIDIGRQSLWGLPFLFGDITIRDMRLWNAVVWTVPYLLLGWTIIKPNRQNWGGWVLFGLWSLVFLTQGPIYSPLVLAAILVALARRQPLWLAALLVMTAGLYARYTRYTWLFAPAMWAGMIWMLQAGLEGHKPLWVRWRPAFIVALAGIMGGLIIPEVLNVINRQLYGVPFQIGSANSAEITVQSVSNNVSRQPLLWERLWPSETYSMGIVWSLVLAVLPLLLILILIIWKGGWKMNWWRGLAIVAPLAAFLGVGLVVSVKIGGGSNLHNVDMFLIGLLFLSGLAWEFVLTRWPQPQMYPVWLNVLLVVAFALPAYQTMLALRPAGSGLPDAVKWADALGGTRDAAVAASKQGEVLFMDQRQLLTFGEVKGVPLVPDYEKKYLMDQAMSDNAEFFVPFIKDMAAHRFSLIVTEPLLVNFQGGEYHFGNENDAWVKWVSIPVLCYYQPLETYPGIVQLLIPRQKPESPGEGITCPQ